MNEKLLLLDGYSLINRAFYAISGKTFLTTQDGIITNAVYGFLNTLHKFLEEDSPRYLCVAFDVKKPTFRHEAYAGYKEGRRKMPEELIEQVPIIREILQRMQIPMVEQAGFEADDIMGTLAVKAKAMGVEVVIVSGDRDLLQVVDEGITVKVPVTKAGNALTEVYDPQKVWERYALKPKQLIDLKSVMGDTSDNIPGVRGVGEKTALPLIQQYGSLEGVYANLHALKGSVKTKFEEHQEMAVQSKMLATIRLDVDVEFQKEVYMRKGFDEKAVRDIFQKLELKTLIPKFLKDTVVPKTPSVEVVYHRLEPNQFDLLENFQASTLSLSYSNEENRPMIALAAKDVYILVLEDWQKSSSFQYLQAFLINPRMTKVVYDYKCWIRVLKTHGLMLENHIFDVMLGGYLIDSAAQTYDLSAMVQREFSEEAYVKEEKEKGVALDAWWIERLFQKQSERLKQEGMLHLLESVEMPLVKVLETMENEGVCVDKEALSIYGEKLEETLRQLEKEIYALAETTFNINSTKQLAEILFERLALPVVKKTKTGYSTDVSVLEELKDKHPVVEKILQYRQIEKLNNTYAKPLMNLLVGEENTIHTRFIQTGTVTGRISSVEPNLQNIPYKQALGRQIRKVFVPRSKDHIFLDADYSQIELRVLAHITEDQNLIQAFVENKDIHALTASKLFHKPESDITPYERSSAKAVNFGILYGLSEFSLAKDLGITRKEAKMYIEEYLGQYPKVQQYMTDIVTKAREEGFVRTLLGRKRDIPEITSKNFNVRSFGERVALNTPIQGSAADLIKLAMVQIYQVLQEEKLDAKLILQVHDEILFDVPKNEQERVTKIVKEYMENAMQLKVPLLAEVKCGENWYETK